VSNEGGYIPWVVQVVGKRESWWIVTTIGVELEFGVCCVWRLDIQRPRSPCGLIVSARGWLVVERNEHQCLWLGG
jgi:hypothetical protein